MSGHKPFSELTKHSSPERNARVAAETESLREEMILYELITKAIGKCTKRDYLNDEESSS